MPVNAVKPTLFRHWFLADFGSLLILIVVSVFLFPTAKGYFNSDAIAYLRIAQYWAAGDPSLAISGYWGPLSSWIMIPLGPWFSDPAELGRAATILGAVVFQLGSIALFRNSGIGPKWYVLAVFATALAAVNWGLYGPITPDLLLPGLLLAGFALFQRALTSGVISSGLYAGLLFGLAYLAKTPGLMLAIGLMVSLSVLNALRSGKTRLIIRQFLIAAGAMSLIVIPWVTTLSSHYEKFTWSTAAGQALFTTLGIMHPNFRYYHHPNEGRITSWEDPTELDIVQKNDVSLFDRAFAIEKNFYYIGRFLTSFDHFSLLFALTVIALVFERGRRSDVPWEPWRLGLVGVVIATAPYLFSYAGERRYFWVCLPFMIGAAFGLLNDLERNKNLLWLNLPFPAVGKRLSSMLVYLLMLVSLIYPLQNQLRQFAAKTDAPTLPYMIGKAVAAKMKESSALGPIAALGGDDHMYLYTALLANVPSYGQQLDIKSVREVTDVGPRYLFVQADHVALSLLRQDKRFIDRSVALLPVGENGKPLSDMVIFELISLNPNRF